MSSEINICNLALSHLGDISNVTSINPPEGSAQSVLCSRFYPIARDMLLEMHDWSFASKKINLAKKVNGNNQWLYAYAVPSDMMMARAIIDPNVANDYSTDVLMNDSYSVPVFAGVYAPQEFSLELDSSGIKTIYTNTDNAVLRYQARVDDPNQFSALFINSLSWHLASMLAGPIIKGDQGQAEGKRCAQMMATFLLQAQNTDTNQRKIKPDHVVAWTTGR